MPDAQGIEAGAELPEGLHLPVHRSVGACLADAPALKAATVACN
jgi:hypothetical protein